MLPASDTEVLLSLQSSRERKTLLKLFDAKSDAFKNKNISHHVVDTKLGEDLKCVNQRLIRDPVASAVNNLSAAPNSVVEVSIIY